MSTNNSILIKINPNFDFRKFALEICMEKLSYNYVRYNAIFDLTYLFSN